MIIQLDKSLASLSFEDLSDFYDNLNICHRDNNHLLFMDIKTCDKLLQTIGDQSPKTKSTITEIGNNCSSLGSIVKNAKFKVIITKDQHSKNVTDDKKTVVFLPYALFEKYTFWNKSNIIAEFPTDMNVYKSIIQLYKKQNNFPYPLMYHTENGGGTTSDQIYLSRQKENDRFNLCIADTDNKFPGDEVPNSTAQKIINADNCNCFASDYYIIDCHEIENLIPISFYKQTNNCSRSLNVIENIEANSPESLLFLDYKKGIKLIDFKKKNDLAQYWAKILNRDMDEIIKEHCSNCSKCLGKSCPKQIIDGFNGTARSNAKEQIHKVRTDELVLPSYLANIWKDIAELMFCWVISGSMEGKFLR